MTKQTERIARVIALWAVSLAIQGYSMAAEPKGPANTADRRKMKLVAKDIIVRSRDGIGPATGFLTYIDKTRPVLVHCYGWEDYSDGYDRYEVTFSLDNGRTWSAPEVRWKGTTVPEGKMRYAEPTGYFDTDTEKLFVLTDWWLHPADKYDLSVPYAVVAESYDPKTKKWSERKKLSFSGAQPAMSFTFPIKTRTGRLLFPGYAKQLDSDGKPIFHRQHWAPVHQSVAVIGEYDSTGDIAWRVGQPLSIDPELSSRGLSEMTLTQLPDGRLVAICRGDNRNMPDKPGYKWLSFSTDEAETWSAPAPLPDTGGKPIVSGSNGSALFRSIKNGKLYWMGNLALHGEPAEGNRPRSSLVIVEVQEQPFALRRETIFAVDERGFNDSARIQFSNFRYYQDRENGDVVIFMVRYGERTEELRTLADMYRYRVEML
jgi:hypothetical protein